MMMKAKEILKNLKIRSSFGKIFKKIDLERIFGLVQRVDSVIVLDINSKIRLLHLNFLGQLKVEALKIVELPKEKKEETITAALADFIRENKIQHKNVIIKPHLNSLLIKRIQLPIVPEKELLEAVKWQIKDEVPYDLAKALISYSVVNKITKEDGSRALEVLCVIAEEEEIRRQVSLL
ncbi:MAG: hypothetical protein ABIH19_02370 [Candidatus Omnitrophota bacterium]